MAFVFDKENHEYWKDGEKLPSVTELVSIFGEDIEERLEDVFAAAAERGTVLHAILADAVFTGEIPFPDVPEEYLPFLESIEKFLLDHDIYPVAAEEALPSSSLQLAGTPDLLCFFDGDLAIIDYKFVAQIAKTKVKAQLNLYRMLFEEQGIFPQKLYAVQFTKDRYRLYPVAIGDEEAALCLRVRELKQKKHTRGRID